MNNEFNKYNSSQIGQGLFNNNEPRERYFDLKEIDSYNELEKRLRRDPKDDTAFYLISNQPEAVSSSAQARKNSKEKHQEKRLSRSRSSHKNKKSKTKANPSFNRSDSEEGFYAKKMMNQNKKTKYQYRTHNSNNNKNSKQQGYQQQGYQPQQKLQQQQQSYIQNQRNIQQEQQKHYQHCEQPQPQPLQKRIISSSYQEPSAYKTQNSLQYTYTHSNNQSRSSKFTPQSLNTPNDVKVIEMSNRKQIRLNRDKNQPEIRINFANKYYK